MHSERVPRTNAEGMQLLISLQNGCSMNTEQASNEYLVNESHLRQTQQRSARPQRQALG